MAQQTSEKIQRKRGRPPKFDKILHQLRTDVLSGKYQPDDRLPTRESLAASFGSTKVTIQKAMDVLIDEGILSARRGAGTYVTGTADSRLPYYLVVSHPQGVNRFKDALVREARKRTEDKHTLTVCAYEGANYTSEDVERLVSLISRQRIAGIIFAAPYSVALKDSPLIQAPGVPKAFIGKDCGPCTPVIDYEGQQTIFSHTLDYFKREGRMSAAVIMTSKTNVHLERSQFRNLAAERGINVPVEWEQAAPPMSDEAASRIIRLMFRDRANAPQSLHIADDNIVPAVTRTLSDMGIRIPHDLLVTAHANFPYPTTSHIPARRIGYDARQFIEKGLLCLDDQRRGISPPDSLIPAIWEEDVPSKV